MLGKIVGAGLGFILGGGPIGAIIGLAIGSALDKGGSSVFQSEKIEGKGKRQTQRGDFSAALIVVSAAVMKADGKILKSELDFVKKYFLKNFGEEVTREKIKVLGEVLKQEIPIDEVAKHLPADGSVWITNNLKYHNAFNGGEENRVHLVACVLDYKFN